MGNKPWTKEEEYYFDINSDTLCEGFVAEWYMGLND